MYYIYYICFWSGGGKVSKIMTIEDIVWPCELSTKIKLFLLDIGIQRQGINCIGGTATSPHAEGLIYCLQGSAIISWSSYDMRNKIGAVLGGNDWLGFMSIDDEKSNYVYSTIEITPVNCLVFPKKAILDYANEDPEMFKLLFYIAKKVVPKWLQASITALHDVELRIVSALIDLILVEPKIFNGQVEINITQQQLSDLTGVSRPRVNEVLKHVERSGQIKVTRNKLQINDINALTQRLQFFNGSLREPIVF